MAKVDKDGKAILDTQDVVTQKNIDIEHTGSKIILPIINGKPMSFDEAMEWMRRKKEEAEKKVGLYFELHCSPLDGAVAFNRAMADKYGWTDLIPTPGFWGDTPPTMVGVPVSCDKKVQTPWGRIQVPGIAGYLETSMATKPTPRFIIGGEVKQKHLPDVQEIVDATQRLLRNQSIYRGQAVKVGFRWSREGRHFNPLTDCPQFIQLSGVQEHDLVLPDDTQNALDIGLFTPIVQADACRRFQVPLKRGVLLYGPFGVGKSLAATVTAIKATSHGWTFIYLESVEDLADGLQFAAQYAPAVVFTEDIDRAVNGERDIEMDEILNILDGVDTKGAEIITVFTTNAVETINPAILRPGRIDTLVEVKAPDATACQRLVKLYSRGLLHEEASLLRIGETLAGKIPAFIREVVERAKIAAIAREGNRSIMGKVLEEDLLAAAKAMEAHHGMLNPVKAASHPRARMLVEVTPNGRSIDDLLSAIDD